jgi:hypothetical protein
MLNDTSYRDRDQVVSRWVQRPSLPRAQRREAKDSHNILMVDQLWIWILKGHKSEDPDTVITSFPRRKGARWIEMDDIATNILKSKDRDPIFKTIDLLSRIITMCCQTLGRHENVASIQFLQFFESTIGNAVSLVTLVFVPALLLKLLNIYRKRKRHSCSRHLARQQRNFMLCIKKIPTINS